VYGEDFKDVSSLKFCVYFVKSGEKIWGGGTAVGHPAKQRSRNTSTTLML
jgi:hypothetical protein